MDICIKTELNLEFMVSDMFDSKMLIPIMKNVMWKAQNEWDDYNEGYRCCQLVEKVKNYPNATMDFHYIKKDDAVAGIILVTYGQIPFDVFFPGGFVPEEAPEAVTMLNSFHVAPEARGIGKHWLRDIILPYYEGKGHKLFYVKSSHPKAFSLYKGLGECVGTYKTWSNNRLFERSGKIFRIIV